MYVAYDALINRLSPSRECVLMMTLMLTTVCETVTLIVSYQLLFHGLNLDVPFLIDTMTGVLVAFL